MATTSQEEGEGAEREGEAAAGKRGSPHTEERGGGLKSRKCKRNVHQSQKAKAKL